MTPEDIELALAVGRVECSAMRNDTCKNGFPVTSPCYGMAGVPICCNEPVCARLYDTTGGVPRVIALHEARGDG